MNATIAFEPNCLLPYLGKESRASRPASAPVERAGLSEIVSAQGRALRQKYGPRLGWAAMLSLLQDRSFVPYPCEVCFDDELLLAGEFAHSEAKGPRREEGFTIYLHPVFADQLDLAPYLVLHQLVFINHGRAATAEDAETFGAQALGISREDYFRTLCHLAEQIGDELC